MSKKIEELINQKKVGLNIPSKKFEGDPEGFPKINGAAIRFAEICEALGATVIKQGVSGFIARNRKYICVGDSANEQNVAFANKVIEAAGQILTEEKMFKFEENFLASSHDGGITGYVATGGDGDGLSEYGVKENLPHMVVVGSIRTANTQDSRQGRSHTYRSYFINKNMVSAGGSVTMRVRDADKHIFIGKGGETIKRLQEELGVRRIDLQAPKYSQEAFEDFFKHITENRIHKRYVAWAKIHSSNLNAVGQYFRLRVRSGGELPEFTQENLFAHYREQFDGHQLTSLDRLVKLVGESVLQLDVSKKLLSRTEQVHRDNPDLITIDEKEFSIGYDSQYVSGEDRYIYSASTKISNSDLEGESLGGGVTLPGGRKVELQYKDNLIGSDHPTTATGYSVDELINNIDKILMRRFQSSFLQEVKKHALNLMPDFLKNQRGGFYKSNLFAKIEEFDAEKYSPSFAKRNKFDNELQNAIGERSNELAGSLVFNAIRKVAIAKSVADKFFAELTNDERRLLKADENQVISMIEDVVKCILDCNEVDGTIAELNQLLDTLSKGKSKILAEYTASENQKKSELPTWLVEYIGKNRLEMAKDCLVMLDAIKRMLGGRTKQMRESSQDELTCGKNRRRDEMKELCGRVKCEQLLNPKEDVAMRLIGMAENNKSSAHYEIANYLFGAGEMEEVDEGREDVEVTLEGKGEIAKDNLSDLFAGMKDKLQK